MGKKSKWNETARIRQQLYRAGKLEIDPIKSDGCKMGKKPKRLVGQNDYASFRCPECDEGLRVNLIRIRPEFYECRTCRCLFQKNESFEDHDRWSEEFSGF